MFEQIQKTLEDYNRLKVIVVKIYEDIAEDEQIVYAAHSAEDKAKLRMMASQTLGMGDHREWGHILHDAEAARIEHDDEGLAVTFSTQVYDCGRMTDIEDRQYIPKSVLNAWEKPSEYNASLRVFIESRAAQSLAAWEESARTQRERREEKERQAEEAQYALFLELQEKFSK